MCRKCKGKLCAPFLQASKFELKLNYFYSIDENDMNPTIVLPQEHANESLSAYVLESDWTFSNMSEHELTYLIRYAPQKSQCFWRKIEGIEGMEEITDLIRYPHIDKPYAKPKLKCQRLVNSHAYTVNSSAHLFSLNTISILLALFHFCLHLV